MVAEPVMYRTSEVTKSGNDDAYQWADLEIPHALVQSVPRDRNCKPILAVFNLKIEKVEHLHSRYINTTPSSSFS